MCCLYCPLIGCNLYTVIGTQQKMLKREAAFKSGEWDPLGDGSSGKSSGVV